MSNPITKDFVKNFLQQLEALFNLLEGTEEDDELYKGVRKIMEQQANERET